MSFFDELMEKHLAEWRNKNIKGQEHGLQNKKKYPWILPHQHRNETFWLPIREPLNEYIDQKEIKAHTGIHNLKSSWALCANLFFPFRNTDHEILTAFLKSNISDLVDKVTRVELEYESNPPPSELLGEPRGSRGQNQTSPDLAFVFETKEGKSGIILTENKFTEHSFYGCSGRARKYGNPDASRCMKFDDQIQKACYQMQWKAEGRENRKYWDFLKVSDYGQSILRRCPAATAGYQLFRQQALAEALIANKIFDYAISCVAYDERNSTLINSLRRTGLTDFRTEWSKIWAGRTSFTTFSHQQWVAWVRKHDAKGQWADWLRYVSERYGYF